MLSSRRHFLCGTAATAAVLASGVRALAQDRNFAVWLDGLRTDAAAHGIRQSTLDLALGGLSPIQKVLDLDQRQPETTITFAQYIDRVVNPHRVENGRQRLAENRALLEVIGAKYDVQPRFIVALWGIETDYGAITGNFPVVGSLATLAYSSSRPDLFRNELLAALKILDRGAVQLERFKGSWAGAMGQTQFMPSSYLRYAVSYDGTGFADIWGNRGDVFASIANYLSKEGWNGSHSWGRQALLPAGFDRSMVGGKVLKPLDQWRALGVRSANGAILPQAALPAGIVQAEGGPALLVYENFRVIMKWNHSTYFASAVSFLADQIQV